MSTASTRFIAVVGIIMLLIGVGVGYGIRMVTFKPPPPEIEEKEDIVIGVIAPITGGYAEGGRRYVECYRQAADEINLAGGVMGRKIILVVEDTAGTPETAVSAVRKLININHVYAIGGMTLSSCAMAVAPVCAEEKVLLFVTNPVTNELTKLVEEDYDTYKYVFRPQLNETQWVLDWYDEAMNAFGFTPKKIIFLTEDLKWARESFDIQKKLYGDKIELESILFAPGTEDFTSIIERIKDFDPDILFVDLLITSSLPFMLQWQEAKPDIFTFHLAGLTTNTKVLIEIDPEIVEYHCMWSDVWDVEVTPKTKHFYEVMTERLGYPVPCQSDVRAYDTLFILADAIERAGTLDYDAVISALESTECVGAAGKYNFAPNHQANWMPGVLIQWIAGESNVIYPKDIAEADFVWPPWLSPP